MESDNPSDGQLFISQSSVHKLNNFKDALETVLRLDQSKLPPALKTKEIRGAINDVYRQLLECDLDRIFYILLSARSAAKPLTASMLKDIQRVHMNDIEFASANVSVHVDPAEVVRFMRENRENDIAG